MRTTLTHAIDFDGLSFEFDAEYVRGADAPNQDLDLCFVWMHGKENGVPRTYDLLKGISYEAKTVIEKNILAVPGVESRLIEEMENMGHELFLEPDMFVKEY